MNTLMNDARMALLQRRSSLQGLPRLDSREAGGPWSGRAPEPVEARAEAVRERLSERDERELRDIDDALVRIEQGRFGHCARCGGAIGRHRLRAIPEARHCMACSAEVGR
jgi:DnaK suppressor protein